MRKYDKIYVPIPKDELSDTQRSLSDFFMNKPLKAIPNIIVLTVKQLYELWDVAYQKGGVDGANGAPRQAGKYLNEYLQSKGITL